MRKIILDLAVSLDGFIEGPSQEVDWIIFDGENGEELVAFTDEVDTVLYGRTSYERYGNHVPSEGSSLAEQQFYDKVNRMTKVVFSNAKYDFEGNPEIIRNDVKRRVLELKSKKGKDIWLFGGSGLITSLLNLDLVDEIRIGINPIILGGGIPLFKEIQERIQLRLIKSKTYSSGLVGLFYSVDNNK
ncbi:dihydrofolate reductase family protein [Parapedobacter deserti]|uniref:Dihydrofolate reductase family protein n=1 Tax=Parapedobacter deserti TaxID=1912957 RepID=A0ABV7JNB6_9SPHI